MNQSSAKRIIPKLRYKIHDRRNLKNPEGPQGRHNKIRKTVTALFKYERIELNYHRADESRGYAERLISDAIRYGDCHQPTMEMANYWLLEKQLIHKLFKVLVPRYQNCGMSYTKLWKAPNIYPGHGRPKCVIELRNNIFPPLGEDKTYNKNLIHNVLLEAARKAFENQKAKENAESSNVVEQQTDTNNTGSLFQGTHETSGAASIDGVAAAPVDGDAAAPVNGDAASLKMNLSCNQSKEIQETDNVNSSEKENSTTISSLEEDLSKLEVNEQKSKKSPTEKEEI